MALLLAIPAAAASEAEALRARHAALAPALAASPFGQPLVIESSAGEGRLSGEIHAVVEHPFADLAATLHEPAAWCDILTLIVNVKQCRTEEQGAQAGLALHLGRKDGEELAEAHEMNLAFKPEARSPEHLQLRLTAARGPFGTEDYRIEFAAVAIDGQRSFIHLRYAYRYGLTARLATQTYLATLGRNKVGFSVAAPAAGAEPVPVSGLRGAIERNTMRYYLAIGAFLDARGAPPAERLERRLRAWFAGTERHARQLREEMTEAEYLEMKQREARRQQGHPATPPPG